MIQLQECTLHLFQSNTVSIIMKNCGELYALIIIKGLCDTHHEYLLPVNVIEMHA